MSWRVCRMALLTFWLLTFWLLPGQEIHLKTRTVTSIPAISVSDSPVVAHRIVQFDHPPGVADLAALAEAGAQVVAVIPDNAVMIAAPAGLSLARISGGLARSFGPLAATDKLSRGLSTVYPVLAIVEFHGDVSAAVQDAVASAEGLTLARPAVLLANHGIVSASIGQLRALANHDEVAYIFPADPDLVSGNEMMACGGMLTLSGPIGQYANIVHGWDLNAGGVANLDYVFGTLITARVPDATVESAVLQALDAWAKYTNVVFHPGTDPAAPRTVVIKFATGAHGDAYPFDSTNQVLAHTFYPTPINSESIAGDMHLNASENWHAGGDIDIYSVALHEAGHALGLGHTDNPGDVMYPYYRRGMVLSANDIAGVQTLYGVPASLVTPAPGTSAPISIAPGPSTVTPAALSLNLNPVSLPDTAAQVSVSGTASGGIAPLTIHWQTDQGYSGKGTVANTGIWNAGGIPLATGTNTLTVTAFDAADHTATQTAVITRLQPAPVSGSPPISVSITAPSSAVTTAGTATISLAGKAAGGAGISKVVWQTSGGASGVANGTGPWLVPNLPLLVGTNTIIVHAFDSKDASAWAAVVVVRH